MAFQSTCLLMFLWFGGSTWFGQAVVSPGETGGIISESTAEAGGKIDPAVAAPADTNVAGTREVTGACCLPDNSCSEMSEADCAAAGAYLGDNTFCEGDALAACFPMACCVDRCVSDLSQSCDQQTDEPCAGYRGCRKTCVQMNRPLCEEEGGRWLGVGDNPVPSCAATPCSQGSCCYPTECRSGVPEVACEEGGGEYHPYVTCLDSPCGGACCMPDGTCESASGSWCDANGGNYQGDGSSCDTMACPAPVDCSQREDCDGDPPRGNEQISGVYHSSGERVEEVEDLYIPGRGLDFVLRRTYRSRAETQTVQGNNWDMSYNMRVAIEGGSELTFYAGDHRRDVFQLNHVKDWYERNEYFAIIVHETNGTFVMHHDDGDLWTFAPLNGSPTTGKIIAMADRHGNEMTFTYDPATGRLVSVLDTLGRQITFAYNGNGFLQSVTDFLGRQVQYEYYPDGHASGSYGDLAAVISPTVTGTPTGNDFPIGKIVGYTYSTGFADDRLNHNLISIFDGKGQEYSITTYDNDTGSSSVDRVIQENLDGDIISYVYIPQTPDYTNGLASTLTIINDRMGNVEHQYFDAGHRMTLRREYTGRADPTLPTTLTDNRPGIRLRDTDLSYYDTWNVWNAHSQAPYTRHSEGSSVLTEFDQDNENPRARGNVLSRTYEPVITDDPIVERFEYLDGFGGGRGGGSQFVTHYWDRRGNLTTHDYDPATGDRTHTTLPPVTVGVCGGGTQTIEHSWEYNSFGQLQRYVGPTGRVDTLTYHDSGPMNGYLHCVTVDADNLGLATCYEYDGAGNVTRVTDPRQHSTEYIVNELDQVVREISAEVSDGSGVYYQTDVFYDANNNLVRIDVQNIDDEGVIQPNTHFTTIFEHNALDRVTRVCEETGSYTGAIPGTPDQPSCDGLPESEFVFTEYEYNKNGQKTLVRLGEAVGGRQPNNTLRLYHDERGLPLRFVRAEGDSEQSSARIDFNVDKDPIRVITGLEGVPHVHDFSYDPYGRLTDISDPEGNTAEIVYDDNGNPTSARVYGERIEGVSGSNSLLLSRSFVYDEVDRLVRINTDFFDPEGDDIGDGLATRLFCYDEDWNLIAVEDDNGHIGQAGYDTAGRLEVITDAKGSTTTFGYDANSNVTSLTELDKSDLGESDQPFLTTYSYDNLDRLTGITDNSGSTIHEFYDSRYNLTRLVDGLDHESRYRFDGLDRLVEMIHDLDGDGADGNGDDIVIGQTWDDSSRLTARTDDAGNTTRYAFDALNRQFAVQMADGTVHQIGSGAVWPLGQAEPDLSSFTPGYDVFSRTVLRTYASGSTVALTRDLVNRLVRAEITPGPGVSDDTTVEVYRYDGLSRLVHAEDDDSVVTRTFDSLGNVVDETLTIDAGGFQTSGTRTATHDGMRNRQSIVYPGGEDHHGYVRRTRPPE